MENQDQGSQFYNLSYFLTLSLLYFLGNSEFSPYNVLIDTLKAKNYVPHVSFLLAFINLIGLVYFNQNISGKGATQKKVETLRELRRLLSKSEVPPVKAALQAGVIPLLVQCLAFGSPDEQVCIFYQFLIIFCNWKTVVLK